MKRQFSTSKTLQFYRPYLIYDMPTNLKISQLKTWVLGQSGKGELVDLRDNQPIDGDKTIGQLITRGVLDLQFNIQEVEKKPVDPLALSPTISQLPQIRIFEQFEKIEGIFQIVEVIVKNLTKWKNKDKDKKQTIY